MRLHYLICSLLFLIQPIVGYQSPSHIKILKESGISVRRAAQSAADTVGIAYPGYTYPVKGSRVAFYKIILSDGKPGWIFANTELNWTEQQSDSRVIIRFQGGGINARIDPYDLTSSPVGIAKSNVEYEIADIYYSHYKITLPDGNSGWVHAGKMSDSWLIKTNPKEIGTEVKRDGFFVDFSNLKPSGTLDIYSVKCNYEGEKGEGYLRFQIPEESYLSVEFDLPKEPRTERLSITHKSTLLEDASLKGRSKITFSINGYAVVQNYDPGSHDFATDRWAISKFLRKGKNRLKIKYNDGSSAYGLKSFRIE